MGLAWLVEAWRLGMARFPWAPCGFDYHDTQSGIASLLRERVWKLYGEPSFHGSGPVD